MAPTILIVDDEPDLLATWERLLRPLGHRCLAARAGFDAVGLIDLNGPDLVVTDLRLPGVDGLAVARHARARVPPIPVLLVSADDSHETRVAAREIGVSAFLAKPLVNAIFLEAVRRALAEGARGPGAVFGA
jgi:CheY-like chemotaxis protein